MDQPVPRVSLKIDGNAVINGKAYESILLLAAPFEKEEVKTNPSILLEKLYSGVDDELADEIATNPAFVFCTALELNGVNDYQSILDNCGYVHTENTIIAIRAFGLTGLDEQGVPDFVEHLSCKIAFNENKIIFISTTEVPQDDAPEENTLN